MTILNAVKPRNNFFGDDVCILLYMKRLIVILLFIFATSSFAEEKTPKEPLKNLVTSFDDFKIGFIWGGASDFSLPFFTNISLTERLKFSTRIYNLHWVEDDDKYRFSPMGTLSSVLTFGVSISLNDRESGAFLSYFTFPISFLLNPNFEFFLVKSSISLSVGYETDWFAFSPGQKFYFKSYSDLTFYGGEYAFVSASFSYLHTHTYDATYGPRFEAKVGISGLFAK